MRDAVARIAAAEIGYRETGNNRTKYNQWMYGYDASAPWCSIFICWCVNEAGAGDSIQNTAIASGYRVSNMGSNPFGAPAYAFSSVEPQPGDIVFIDNTGNGVSNHTGLVVDVDEDYIYTAIRFLPAVTAGATAIRYLDPVLLRGYILCSMSVRITRDKEPAFRRFLLPSVILAQG